MTVARPRVDPVETKALVPTMGALHDGHLALVRRAQELADRVVVSIFVNPTQFGANEDFDKYPRTLEADRALLAPLGAEVFAPKVDEVYPRGPLIEPVEIGYGEDFDKLNHPKNVFEGATRPGHFDGVLTVVARLIDMTNPDVVVFGQKDAQQVFLVKQMLAERYPRIRMEVVPTVREPDGLAMSSRNRYLSANERQHALVLFRALTNLSLRLMSATFISEALMEARSFVEVEPEVRLDYLEIVDPATFKPVDDSFRGGAIAVVAAWVGTTRLIDTVNLIV